MPNNKDDKRYVTLADACELLNRDVEHIREFFDDTDVEVVTVGDELCVNADALIECITATIDDLADDESDE